MFCERKNEAEVVEKKSRCVFQKSAEVVEKVTSTMVLHPKRPAFHVRAFDDVLHAVRPAPVKFVVKRLVLDAVVAKKLVEVLFEVVAFFAVKFWRVVLPVARMLVAVSVPVRVSFVPFEFVNAKFVAKKLVEVADVPVAFTKVKFWRVDEPVMRRFGVVMRPAVVRDPVKFAAEEIV